MIGPYRLLDCFAGVGAFRLGFERAARALFGDASIRARPLAIERDRFSCLTYSRNFCTPPDEIVPQDIREIETSALPPVDILTAGFPCQPFSVAGTAKYRSLGRKRGFEDERQGTLFFEALRLLRECRPLAFVLENVKRLAGMQEFQVILRYLEEAGYKVHHTIVDASLYVPQNRERLFIVGFDRKRFGSRTNFTFRFAPPERRLRLADILEPEVPNKYVLSDKLWNFLQEHKRKHALHGNGYGYRIADVNGTAATLCARYGKDGGDILIDRGPGKNPRRLTPRECARLMGFPDSFVIPVSDTQAYRQFGNSIVVPVAEEVALNVLETLESL